MSEHEILPVNAPTVTDYLDTDNELERTEQLGNLGYYEDKLSAVLVLNEFNA
jgi:hypothetical protein